MPRGVRGLVASKSPAAGTAQRQHEKIVIENPGQFSQDRKLDDGDRAVQQVFYALDSDRSGELNLKEFHEALKQMDIVLPVPVVRFIFDAIDVNGSEDISFDEFMAFINDDSQSLEFQAEYVAEFHTEEIGLELVLESDMSSNDPQGETGSSISGSSLGKTRVYVANIFDDDARNYVLPNSEVIKIDGIPVSGKSTKEIGDLIKSKLETTQQPCQITFKKTSNAEEKEKVAKMLGLMMGDEDWLVLSKHVSKQKLEERVKLLKQPNLPDVRTKHCPVGDPATNWWVWIHLTFEDENFSKLSNFVVSFVTILIFVSTLGYVLQTVPALRDVEAFVYIEAFVSLCFTIEYAAKIFTSRNAWIFFVDTMSMIDFLAIIPWWIEISFGSAAAGGNILRVIRVIRLARVFRLLKTPTFSKFLDIFVETFKRSSSSAGLLLTIIMLSVVIFASLMYFCEQGSPDPITGINVRPEDGEPSPFTSIFSGMWWCVVTMTTVGYGDLYPISTLGYAVATISMFIGLFVIALPVIIIGTHFEDVWADYRTKQERERRRAQQEADKSFDESVEKYLDDINNIINAASGVQDIFVPFFTAEDKTAFVDETIDTKEKLIEVLKVGVEGIHFLPRRVPEYKLFVLYEVFGKGIRSEDQDMDKFAKVKKHLVSKIQMI